MDIRVYVDIDVEIEVGITSYRYSHGQMSSSISICMSVYPKYLDSQKYRKIMAHAALLT